MTARGAHKQKRRIIPVVAALAGAALLNPFKPEPLIVWNVTSSAPIGFYRLFYRPAKRGDYVLAHLPREAAVLAQRRGYLPLGRPALKKIAAQTGDVVCRREGFIFINHAKIAEALETDAQKRAMPVWAGCRALGANEVFLLNDHPESFDGRYIGAVRKDRIIAVAVLQRARPGEFWERAL